MVRLLVRRMFGTVMVLFAISVIVFLIFNIVPATNPAQRIAGKNATPQLIRNVEKEWGFDRSLPGQYLTQMELILTAKAKSYSFAHANIDESILEGVPVTASLCVGAAVIWLSFAILFGYTAAVSADGPIDRCLAVLALIGVSTPVFLLASVLIYYLTYKIEIFPPGDYEAPQAIAGRSDPRATPVRRGDQGTAKAWAEMSNASVVLRSSPDIAINAFRQAKGVYCVKAEPFNSSNSVAMVNLDDSAVATSIGDGVVVANGEDGNVCPENQNYYFAVYPANQNGESKDAGFVILID